MRQPSVDSPVPQSIQDRPGQAPLGHAVDNRNRHVAQRRRHDTALMTFDCAGHRGVVPVRQVRHRAVPANRHAPAACNYPILIQQQHVVLREELGDLCLVLLHDRVMREKKLGPLDVERCVRLVLEVRPLTGGDDVHDRHPNEMTLPGCGK